MKPNERTRAGLFLAFQRPVAISGVKMANFLRHAATNVRRPDRKEGVRMIVTGFFQQVFDRIPVPTVRHALGEAIARRVREYE